jgi:hypothetical protein
MPQVVSCWPLTVEAQVHAQVSPCGIYAGQSGTGTGFSPSPLVSPCQYYYTVAPYLYTVSPRLTRLWYFDFIINM